MAAISPYANCSPPCRRTHLVFCGDVINRGEAIPATMNLVWDLVQAGRATWLRGNHEHCLLYTSDAADE